MPTDKEKSTDLLCEILQNHDVSRCTNLELQEWLAKGNGLVKSKGKLTAFTLAVTDDELDKPCDTELRVRRFGTKEWAIPTPDYCSVDYSPVEEPKSYSSFREAVEDIRATFKRATSYFGSLPREMMVDDGLAFFGFVVYQGQVLTQTICGYPDDIGSGIFRMINKAGKPGEE